MLDSGCMEWWLKHAEASHLRTRPQASDIRWASRWDTYLLAIDDQIHWFSIFNSVMIVLFLTGMVAVIIIRVLRRDITNYNQLESGEDAQEETGWKLVGGGRVRVCVCVCLCGGGACVCQRTCVCSCAHASDRSEDVMTQLHAQGGVGVGCMCIVHAVVSSMR